MILTPHKFLFIIIAILIGSCLLDVLVNWLNVRQLTTRLPVEFEGYYDAARYQTAQDYLSANARLAIIKAVFFTALIVAFILAGGFALVDQAARHFQAGAIITGLIFAAILMVPVFFIQLPFSVYETFVIEERYGFNRMTVSTFVLDLLKSVALVGVLGALALALVLWFFEKSGSWAWVYAWLGLFGFQLFLIFIAPVVIMPLFNKFVPLPPGELRQAIETYARSQDFKMQGVYAMDGSKRSSKANAMFTGFGRFRRIVLYDTLIQKHTVPELVSVLAHEVGHYQRRHIFKFLLISLVSSGLMFFILSLMIRAPALFQAFGVAKPSVYAGIVFFGLLYTPIDMTLSVFGNWMSRQFEYEADAFAVTTANQPESMIVALKKLSVDNLANLTPHPLKVFFDYSHPPVLQRIEAIRRREQDGGQTTE
ncbi:MAG: M48 family metallopeptidase [Verrucomicrobia bacterium]|nr:M48 family metallopeptidase [Verrucomicrobiota bacterium]MBU1735939.1 M48 family metallopeptidase [Verrucomicrobiota bacterium]MBU1855603.1 M48 family metallopeptidase [Verrucomicrobiota bacterium]